MCLDSVMEKQVHSKSDHVGRTLGRYCQVNEFTPENFTKRPTGRNLALVEVNLIWDEGMWHYPLKLIFLLLRQRQSWGMLK